MKATPGILIAALAAAVPASVRADISLISPQDAKALIENADPAMRPVVLDTRGGYKDYFRGQRKG
ncbi:MAG: hypothetical protein KGS60_16100 [Verrucomicrobia bacterium]|nr:hypothetical protein [Verrucomicrobiota bacterium]